ncbi:3-carboxy-cis,cis-muconate cycloisomerase [Microbulbifer sp. OS29]|uniref:3-carboxy-cis,cis-muconate cycloisomerase n=1 Tax=Microbulbifer okhotskensis TaxID=2926617 RepID=A0A9X2EQW9_9GAMM|nr:3-carboxy-cis,cis-muconate cycloisomerase [Microbulbifer okhotskensis]MCO1334011.1 3-carboxy-cis,cis-muconate cycloisomerase [Microbulbifer okhotskensis]
MTATMIDSVVFRDIFSTSAMRDIFSDVGRVQYYLDVEAALAKVQSELGIIPNEAAEEICKHCDAKEIDLIKLKTQTELIGYPVLGVVQQLVSLCGGGLGQWCHWGATTQDITDTATVLQMKAALGIVESEVEAITEALASLAERFKDTPMVARSNLQQAVPITFGYKAAVWLAGFHRHRSRLKEIEARVFVGEFGGAAGNLSSLGHKGLQVQAGVMSELGLGAPCIAWHTMRDRIAEVACLLGLITGSLGKIALDIKLMAQTEVGEVAEPFSAGRGSSSTMPQKHNPISSVFISATVPVIRQQVASLLEAMVEDHERATGPWEIEWIVLPEIFCLSASALGQARYALEGLQVFPEKMMRNLKMTGGLVSSEAVMMGLGAKMGREYAHDLVYKICCQAIDGGRPFSELLKENSEISSVFSAKELDALLDPCNYLGLCGEMVEQTLAMCDK